MTTTETAIATIVGILVVVLLFMAGSYAGKCLREGRIVRLCEWWFFDVDKGRSGAFADTKPGDPP
jgi:hypothetical protein